MLSTKQQIDTVNDKLVNLVKNVAAKGRPKREPKEREDWMYSRQVKETGLSDNKPALPVRRGCYVTVYSSPLLITAR